jgi:hypothetical protein
MAPYTLSWSFIRFRENRSYLYVLLFSHNRRTDMTTSMCFEKFISESHLKWRKSNRAGEVTRFLYVTAKRPKCGDMPITTFNCVLRAASCYDLRMLLHVDYVIPVCKLLLWRAEVGYKAKLDDLWSELCACYHLKIWSVSQAPWGLTVPPPRRPNGRGNKCSKKQSTVAP